MVFKKSGLVGFAVLAVALIAIAFSGCASFGTSASTTPGRVTFGMSNDTQNNESMAAYFDRTLRGFAFECMYSGNRRPDTLLVRIDNGSAITLKVTYVNSVSGMMEFAISDDVVNQLLNCNDNIGLEFNNASDYVRTFTVTSEQDAYETKRANNYNTPAHYNGPLGVKNLINYWNNR